MCGASRSNTRNPSAKIPSSSADRDQQPPLASRGLRRARRGRVDHRVAELLDDRRQRVQHQKLLDALRHVDRLDRVDDRGRVEGQLEHDLPDRLDVPEPHVERREQHRQAGHEDGQRGEQERDLEPRPARPDAGGEREDEHHEQVERQVERGGQHDRHRDRHPRELDLAHQVLALDDRVDRARALREERVEHDVGQQDDGIERDRPADLHELREDDVEHAEQQQRAHELPQVAEHRAEEAQLELGRRQRDRQVREPAQAAAERARAGDRGAELGAHADARTPRS